MGVSAGGGGGALLVGFGSNMFELHSLRIEAVELIGLQITTPKKEEVAVLVMGMIMADFLLVAAGSVVSLIRAVMVTPH